MSAAATTATDERPKGPLLQSIAIVFTLGALGTLALAAFWLASDVREVPPDATALVSRFGRVVTVQGAGLLLAWPHPIDSVALLPGPDRQLGLAVESLPRAAGLDSAYTTANPAPAAGGAGSYLTGDGGVVLLDAELTWRVTDPVAYMLAETHVAPALNRVFRAAAVRVAAGARLDDFLVVDQSRASGRPTANARIRAALLAATNAALATLGQGVEVTRIDLTAALPPAAKLAFDSVLTATQVADQALANARADATRRQQAADRERDRLLNVARAASAERVAAARTHAATPNALAAEITPANRANLLDQVYRARLAALMPRIGQVTAIDARGGPRVILPGTRP